MRFEQTGNISQNERIQALVVTDTYVSVNPIMKIKMLENIYIQWYVNQRQCVELRCGD